jgi:hypothetical protein
LPLLADTDFGGVASLLQIDRTLYLGGSFLVVNRQLRRGLAAIDLKDNLLLPWDPSLTPNGASSLARIGDFLVCSGGFNLIGPSWHPHLAALPLPGSTPATWMPNSLFGGKLLAVGQQLVVAGTVIASEGREIPHLAVYQLQ